MKYTWIYKVAKKRTSFLVDFAMAKLFGTTYTTREGVELIYSTPYHHHMAKVAAKGEIEPEMMALWVEKAKIAKLIYDIGGFNGIYGLTAAKVNPEAQVLIFEPDFVNLKHIYANIRLNGLTNCIVYPVALSDFRGTQEFTTRGTTASRLGEGTTKVICATLDDYVAPDLIKIDAAGAEGAIIRGAHINLHEKPTIFLQTDDIAKDHGEMWRTLEDLGYKATFLEEIPSGVRCVLECV